MEKKSVKQLLARASSRLVGLSEESVPEDVYEGVDQAFTEAYLYDLCGDTSHTGVRRAMRYFLGLRTRLGLQGLKLPDRVLNDLIVLVLPNSPQLAWWLATGFHNVLPDEARRDLFEAALGEQG